MSTNRLYPVSVVKDSVESLFAHQGPQRPKTYWLLVAGIATVLVTLPIIRMDVSVGARGVVRPVAERVTLRAPVGGEIKAMSAHNNSAVRRGDPILIIESRILTEKIALSLAQQQELSGHLADLQILVESASRLSATETVWTDQPTLARQTATVAAFAFQTPGYLRQWDYFSSQLQVKVLLESRARQDKERAAPLKARGLVSPHEFEQATYAAESAVLERQQLLRQNLSRWQAERLEKEARLRDLVTEARQLERQQELYTVRAPADGTILEFTGLDVGAFVVEGMKIAEITPDGQLVVDAYVAPKDVGFIRTGQHVRMLVDAFPYTQWGTLAGTVRTISEDVVHIGDQTVFKAVISLAATELKSGSGTQVRIGKGMGINARFIVANRSLFELLRDRVSEWLDPVAS